ncbi:MAG: hypothetical protein AAGI44_11520 [Pseudomonadota bacterium]
MVSTKVNTIARAIRDSLGREPTQDELVEEICLKMGVSVSKDTMVRSWMKEKKVALKWLDPLENALRAFVPIVGSKSINDNWVRFDNERYAKSSADIRADSMPMLVLAARGSVPIIIKPDDLLIAGDYALARGLLGFMRFRQHMETKPDNKALLEAAMSHLKIAMKLMRDIEVYAKSQPDAQPLLAISIWRARFSVSFFHIGIERFEETLIEDPSFRDRFVAQAEMCNYFDHIQLLMDIAPHFFQGPHGAIFMWALRNWHGNSEEEALALLHYHRSACAIEPRLENLEKGKINETIKPLGKEPILVEQQHALKILGAEK